MSDYQYEKIWRVKYVGGAWYIPICPTCGRYVKADESIMTNCEGMPSKEPNATCSKCGRVNMPFEGFMPEDEE